jgi:GntR family transcriptional repressor for pyruvate dehydrogenase complex
VADHVRRRIVSGDLHAGSPLPPLRSLAELFGVSLPTMHAAMHALVALGLVNVRPGIGSFVAQPRTDAAVLNHAWLRASQMELAAMRAVIDERLAYAAAKLMAHSSPTRVPATLDGIHLFAGERSGHRHSYPEQFLRADTAFHRMIGASLRGYEVVAGIRDRIDGRLHHAFMAVADVLAVDDLLHQDHLDLAAAVMDGRPLEARRVARRIANHEAAALGHTLG